MIFLVKVITKVGLVGRFMEPDTGEIARIEGFTLSRTLSTRERKHTDSGCECIQSGRNQSRRSTGLTLDHTIRHIDVILLSTNELLVLKNEGDVVLCEFDFFRVTNIIGKNVIRLINRNNRDGTITKRDGGGIDETEIGGDVKVVLMKSGAGLVVEELRDVL